MFEKRIEIVNANTEAQEMPVSIPKRTYTVDEIIDILEISKSTAYNLVNSGVFHSVRVGGQHRISKKSFDEWLDGENGGKK